MSTGGSLSRWVSVEGVSLSEWSLSWGVSVWGSLPRGSIYPGGVSLSGGLSVWEGSLSGRSPMFGNVQAVRNLLECILVDVWFQGISILSVLSCVFILVCKKYAMCITLLELNSKLNLSDIKSKQ